MFSCSASVWEQGRSLDLNQSTAIPNTQIHIPKIYYIIIYIAFDTWSTLSISPSSTQSHRFYQPLPPGLRNLKVKPCNWLQIQNIFYYTYNPASFLQIFHLPFYLDMMTADLVLICTTVMTQRRSEDKKCFAAVWCTFILVQCCWTVLGRCSKGWGSGWGSPQSLRRKRCPGNSTSWLWWWKWLTRKGHWLHNTNKCVMRYMSGAVADCLRQRLMTPCMCEYMFLPIDQSNRKSTEENLTLSNSFCSSQVHDVFFSITIATVSGIVALIRGSERKHLTWIFIL